MSGAKVRLMAKDTVNLRKPTYMQNHLLIFFKFEKWAGDAICVRACVCVEDENVSINKNVESEKWKSAILFYVIGVKPSFNAVRNYVHHQ